MGRVSLTAAGVTERLQRAAALSEGAAGASRIDMSAERVSARLRELADVSALCLELTQASRRRSAGGSSPPSVERGPGERC